MLSLMKKWKNTTSIYSGTFLKKLQVHCYVAINHSHYIANFLRCLLEDECMPSHSIKTVSKFYGDWSHAVMVRKCQLLFAQLRRQNRSISVAEFSKELSQNSAQVSMPPNFVSTLKTYIVLPSSACEAEQSFSTLRRLKMHL